MGPMQAAAVVGTLWGATNPLVKRGSLVVQRKLALAAPERRGWLAVAWAWATTPEFVVPQLLNQAGSVLFIYLLGSGEGQLGTLVPSANAVSLAVNAITDCLVLEERFKLPQLALGVLAVGAGVLLCGTA